MSFKYLLFSALVTFQAQAQVQKVMIGNQAVEVSEVEWRPTVDGRQVVHSARLVAPTELIFTRGNHLRFSGKLIFHDNGSVWMAESSEGMGVTPWNLPDGQTLPLHCGQPPMVNGKQAPAKYIVFHDNGEYGSGCQNLSAAEFIVDSKTTLGVTSLTEIDLDASGSLKYARRISHGEIELFGQKVSLDPGSEVDFNNSGKIHFFRLAKDQSLEVPTGRLGPVMIKQVTRPSYTVFNEQGQLENAVIGQALRVGDLLAPAGSLLSFEKRDVQEDQGKERELSVLLPAEQALMVGGRVFWASQVQFDGNNQVIGVLTTRAFDFHSPEGDDIHVPASSKVYFLPTGKIIRIDVGN